DDYESFWECRFEMDGGDAWPALDELGALVRDLGVDPHDLEREAWMRAELARALAGGYAAGEILVVCGAAHAPALAGDWPVDAVPAPPERAARLTLVAYSYPRLSEQLGYGAGNRAPAYYQSVWEQENDF